MNGREIVRRLEAWRAGKALPRGATIHVQVADPGDSLLLAFVRMGGESRPWGVSWTRPGRRARLLTAPEGRNRDLVAEMLTEFAPALLEHLQCAGWCADAAQELDDVTRLRQVWLPNRTHLDMLHHIAFAYTNTQSGGDKMETLRALGRACGWLFREAQRPGQQTVIVATDALRSSFAFPAEDSRQAHLGFLLAWLTAHGRRGTRLGAALAAERLTIATTLDPGYERLELAQAVEDWNEARRLGDERQLRRAARSVESALAPELDRRLALTAEARTLIETDRRPYNPGLERLVEDSRRERWWHYLRIEQRLHDPELGPAFVPGVETDRHGAAAAARFHDHNGYAAKAHHELLVHDVELQAEAIASGDAIRGTIVEVRDEGEGRATRPIWVLEQPFASPLRLREGSDLCVAELPSRGATIRSFHPHGDGYRFELEITGLKTARRQTTGRHGLAPVDERWLGETLTLVSSSDGGIDTRKRSRVWNRDVPGAWLTHDRPGGAFAVGHQEDADDYSSVADALDDQEPQ